MKKKKESVYKWFEEHFPEHLIIQKEGFMYSVHGLSANALGTIMEYKSLLRPGNRESDTKLFKCFNPPEGGTFEAGKEYEWEWCIDGIVVYDGSGAPTAFGEYEVFQFFSLISGW